MGNQNQAGSRKTKNSFEFPDGFGRTAFQVAGRNCGARARAHAIGELPLRHRDPFDRMLVAQAKTESLTLVTRDIRLKEYEIRLLKG